MKEISGFLFLLIFSVQLFAQEERKLFLNESKGVCDSVDATFYRILRLKEDNKYIVEDYWIDDNRLYQEGTVNIDSSVSDFSRLSTGRPVKNGEFNLYFKNGQKKESGSYSIGVKEGLFEEWYSNGQKKGDFLYGSDGSMLARQMDDSSNLDQEFRILNYYDSLGNALTTDGNGTFNEQQRSYEAKGSVENGLKHGKWTGTFNNRRGSYSFTEYYEKGKVVSGVVKDSLNTKVEYQKLRVQPKYAGGIQAFYEAISKNMSYPKQARRRRIQGIVYVQFIVDETGTPTDIKVAKGVHPLIDEQAILGVSKVSGFSPGFQRGLPVRVRMMMPIVFKLK